MKKRICCFCEKWASGGIESFLFNTFSHMELSDLEIDIVAAKMSASIFTEPLKQRGIRFFQLSGSPYKIKQNRELFGRILQTRKYDAIHLQMFNAATLMYAQQAKKAGVPIRIGHSHCTAVRSGKGWLIKSSVHALAKRLWLGSLTAYWACSRRAAAYMYAGKAIKQREYRIIPNGIETMRFAFSEEQRIQTRKALGAENRFVVGHIGRLCQEKNQAFLLEIFAALLPQCPNGMLLLVGDDETNGALQEKAKALGIAQHVRFYGHSDEVEKLLWAMDVFVMPSMFEGLGMAAIEAQCAGVPVVCADTLPAEAFATPYITRRSLQETTEQWARTILAMPHPERKQGAERVKDAGYDASETAKAVKKAYCQEEGERG